LISLQREMMIIIRKAMLANNKGNRLANLS
jgi:hypothetical protein